MVAAIALSLSDVKRSDSSSSSPMTICCSFSVTMLVMLLGAATADLSRCSSAVASCFLTNLIEVLSCEWLYFYVALIFRWASLASAPPLVNRVATAMLARMMVALVSCLTSTLNAAAFAISVYNLSWLVAPVSLQLKANAITSVTCFRISN